MNYWCKSCWTPKLYGKDKCRSCSHQPGLIDQHMWNPITCKFGYKNCVNDPGYIYATDPDWYKELYGNKSYEEAAKDPESGCALCTAEHCQYDDEDKQVLK